MYCPSRNLFWNKILIWCKTDQCLKYRDMKIKYILWIFVVIGMIGWQSCSDDSETLTPSDMEEWKPVLASGNNVYDEKIEDFYNRTGVYPLPIRA